MESPLSCASDQHSPAPLPQATWFADSLELEDSPRKLCYSSDAASDDINSTWQYTGFKISVVWDCNDDNAATQSCSLYPTSAGSALETAVRAAQTTCCRHTQYGGDTTAIQFAIGQCTNPNVVTCCQGPSPQPRSRCSIVRSLSPLAPCFPPSLPPSLPSVGPPK